MPLFYNFLLDVDDVQQALQFGFFHRQPSFGKKNKPHSKLHSHEQLDALCAVK